MFFGGCIFCVGRLRCRVFSVVRVFSVFCECGLICSIFMFSVDSVGV